MWAWFYAAGQEKDSNDFTVADPELQQIDEALGGVVSEFIAASEFSAKAVSPLSICAISSLHNLLL